MLWISRKLQYSFFVGFLIMVRNHIPVATVAPIEQEHGSRLKILAGE